MNRVPHSASSILGCLLAFAILCVLFCVDAQGQTYQSRNNHTGIASYPTSWEGAYPTITGDLYVSSGSVIVQGYLLHGISGNTANASFTGTGTFLLVEDTLRIFGDLFMYNDASVHIKPGGVLIVDGNYWQDANVDFINEGNSIFLGNWESAGRPESLFNTGGFYVAGTFTADGTGNNVAPKDYAQLETDNPSLYAFSRNKPLASECANNNSGSISFTDPHLQVLEWQSSTDFFQYQITTIASESTSQAYTNLSKTTSFRVYYQESGGGLVYSDASTIVVRDIMNGGTHAVAKAEVPVGDLMASYSLDGHANDGSGNGNHGTVHGGAFPVKDRFGMEDNAYYFDGIDDYISTTTHYPSPGPQQFSISIWFKTTTTTGGRLIGFGDVQTGESNRRDRNLYMTDNGQLYFGVYQNHTTKIVNTTESFNDGQWHHAVVTLSAAGMDLYVDGSHKASNPEATGGEIFGGYWKIGYDNLNGWPSAPLSMYYKGDLDDIYIFKNSLGPAEIERLHQAGVRPVCEGETINLISPSIPGATYSWSGPDGFASVEQNPVIPAITAAKEGRYTVTISAEDCSSQGGTDVVIAPPAQGGTVTASQESVCNTGPNSVTLTLESYVGSIVRWEKSTDNFGASIEPITHTAAELTITDLLEETSYRAIVGGNCGEVSSLPVTIKIESTPQGGSLSGGGLGCFGENSGSITLSGHTGTVLRWERSVDNFLTVEPIAITATNFTYTNLLQNTSYRAVVANTCSEAYSTVAEVNIQLPLLTGAPAVHLGEVPAGDLMVAYPFNGNTGDFSGNANHGDVIGAIPASDRFGVAGKAYSFDGVDDNVFSSTKYPAPGPNVFSISIWFKTTDPTGARLIGYSGQQKGWSSNFDRHIYLNDQGHIYFGVFSGGIYKTVQTTQTYTDGQWHHVVASLSSEGLKLFVDGQLKGSDPSVTVGEDFSGYWRLGGDSMGGEWPGAPTHPYFEGELDEILIYNRELNEAEVGQLFRAGIQEACEGEGFALSAPSLAGATYAWTGPDNFVSAEQYPVIPNFNTANAGFYSLTVSLEGCQSQLSTLVNLLPGTVGGTLTTSQEQVCQDGNSGLITLSDHAGNVIRWESSVDNFTTDITPIAHTTTEYAFSNLLQTTSFRVLVGNEAEKCTDKYSSEITITVEPTPVGGEVSASASQVCAGSNSGTISLSGQLGEVIRWESSTDNFTSDIVGIAHTSTELTFQDIFLTTSFRAVVGNASCGELYSSLATIEAVEGPVGGTLSGGKYIISGENAGTLVLQDHRGEILQWEISHDNFSADIQVVANAQGQDQLTYQNIEVDTWYRVQLSSPSCSPVYSQTALLKVNSAPLAENDSFNPVFGQSFTSDISLLDNDSDPDGHALVVGAVEGLLTEKGNKVTIDASGYFVFEPVPGFSGADSFQYQLCDEVGEAAICTSGTVFLQVDLQTTDREIVVYQGFSPHNGDEKNNVWVIQNIEYHPKNLVQVYNRYGILVYEERGYNNAEKVFEGFSNRGAGVVGRQLPQGTYYYQIRLDENSPGITGFVILNR